MGPFPQSAHLRTNPQTREKHWFFRGSCFWVSPQFCQFCTPAGLSAGLSVGLFLCRLVQQLPQLQRRLPPAGGVHPAAANSAVWGLTGPAAGAAADLAGFRANAVRPPVLTGRSRPRVNAFCATICAHFKKLRGFFSGNRLGLRELFQKRGCGSLSFRQ